jgi:predicted O-methyltransferase YrrM
MMALTWFDDEHFRVDGVDFVCSFDESTPDRFCIRKDRALVERTVALLDSVRPARIAELGIAYGGSVALITLVARPSTHIAVELSDTRVGALDNLITSRSLEASVQPFYGVDQGDRARLAEIVATAAHGEPLDLVIDDASHRLDETRASFETLFPLLRPGGVYVIEDWNWHLKLAFGLAHPPVPDAVRPAAETEERAELRAFFAENLDREPLETLAVELLLARACSGDAIASVAVDGEWVVARRGRGALDPQRFRVADCYVDRGILGTEHR